MTLEDIENWLPNGLHDAKLRQLVIDYTERTLTVEVSIWVGDLIGPSETREEYRPGQIEITGLVFVVMEPPDPRYAFDNSPNLTIDGCDLRQNLGVELLKSLPEKSFFRSLWVGEWNAFIHVAATDAKFSWVDEPSDVEEAKS